MNYSLKEKIDCPIKDPESYKILNNPELLKRLIDECGKRIVNERTVIKTLLLCSFGRLVENANHTSYNLMVNDESGAGKDFVTSNVLKLLPKENIEKRTRISPTAFTYWHNSFNEPDWTWDSKVCYLEDISSGVLNNEVFKVMCSSGSHATIVKDSKALDIEVKGKPVIIVTTYSATPSKEMLRRFAIINLDCSKEQTQAIIKKQLSLASQGKTDEYDKGLIKSLTYLTRVNVKIPYADLLSEFLPNSLIMRTNNQRFLDYIKASASLYQFQRARDDESYLLANGEDYDNAREIIIKTTTNNDMIPLTKEQQAILSALKGRGWLSVNDLLPELTLSDRWLKTLLDRLVNMGIIKRDKQEREEVKKKVSVYSYEPENEVLLPSWGELIKKCKNSSVNSSYSFNSGNSINSVIDYKPSNEQPNKPNKPNSEFGIYNAIIKIIKSGHNNEAELIEFLEFNNVSNKEETLSVLKKMLSEGVIFEPQAGRYKLTESH